MKSDELYQLYTDFQGNSVGAKENIQTDDINKNVYL